MFAPQDAEIKLLSCSRNS